MNEWFSRRTKEHHALRKVNSCEAATRHCRDAYRPEAERVKRLRGRTESCWRTSTSLSLWNHRAHWLLSTRHRGRQKIIRGCSRGFLQRGGGK